MILPRRKVDVRLPEEIIEKIHESGMTQTQFVEKACNNFVNNKSIEQKLVNNDIKNVRILL